MKPNNKKKLRGGGGGGGGNTRSAPSTSISVNLSHHLTTNVSNENSPAKKNANPHWGAGKALGGKGKARGPGR